MTQHTLPGVVHGSELDHVGWCRWDDDAEDYRELRPLAGGDDVTALMADGWLPVWVHWPEDRDPSESTEKVAP